MNERMGYPTQKPLALLERIIKASSNKGDRVLDPFCGCATACVAAERLGRNWIGIDVSIKAYELIKQRMEGELDQDKIHFSTTPPVRSRNDVLEDEAYVYIISNKAFPDEYKVGIAHDYKRRLSGYQTSDPQRGYKIEEVFLTPHYRRVEKYIHNLFPNKHEWVQGDLEDIANAIGEKIAKLEGN